MNDLLQTQKMLDRRLGATETKEVGRTSYGTTKPSTWPIGVPFFDATANMWVYWDGANWLTVHEYEADLTPYVVGSTARIAVTTTVALLQPMRTDYHAGLTRIKVYCDVLTTNNGANYWTIVIGTNTTTSWSPTTAADAAGAGINKETAPGTDVTGSYWQCGLTKNGAPGSIALNVSIWYRLIIP